LAFTVAVLGPAFVPSSTAVDYEPPGPIIAGANAQLDAVCEKSAQQIYNAGGQDVVVGTGQYSDRTNKIWFSGGNYDLILADDPSDSGSDNVTFGMRYPFTGLVINVATAGTVGDVKWKYSVQTSGAQMWKDLAVTDETQDFHQVGTHKVTWNPPADWVPAKWKFGNCDGDQYLSGYGTNLLYRIQVSTQTNYAVQPLSDWAGAILGNYYISVETELHEPVQGLSTERFEVTEGYDTGIYGIREPKAGQYELALRAGYGTNDHDYVIAVRPPGYAKSLPQATGVVSRIPINHTESPLVIFYAIKVVVKDEDGDPVKDAEVTWGGREADRMAGNSFYFVGQGSGELVVKAEGYDDFSTAVDSAARSVYAGELAQTAITLEGKGPCDDATQVLAGAALTCSGLHPLFEKTEAPTPPSSSQAVSFSFPAPTYNPGAKSSSSSSAAPTAPPCQQNAPASGGVFSKTVSGLTSGQLVRLCMDQAAAVGVERVDVALGLEAKQVEVRVSPADSFKGEWAAKGIDSPPGDYQFGFVEVGVKVDGIDWKGPVQATTFRFHVTRQQLADSGLGAEDVQVYRWDGEAWQAVPTQVDQASAGDYVFSSSSPGQGLFAVSGMSSAVAPTMPLWPWLIGGVVALGLIVTGIVVAVKRKHHVHAPTPRPPAPTPPKKDPAPSGPVTIPHIK